MQQQNRRPCGVALPEFHHIQRRAGDRDAHSLLWIAAFDHDDADLREKREENQRRQNYRWNHYNFPQGLLVTREERYPLHVNYGAVEQRFRAEIFEFSRIIAV